MTTFFTADTHFGHAGILRSRPFVTIAEHDDALVARWNARVGPDDDVWHLGDFACGASRERCAAIFACLNGTKRLVQGNHDTNRVLGLPWAAPPVHHIRIVVRNRAGEEARLYLGHYPMRSWPGLFRGTRHLFGHTHATLPGTTQSCDVGVDAWGFAPASLDEILARQDAAEILPEELALRNPGLARRDI